MYTQSGGFLYGFPDSNNSQLNCARNLGLNEDTAIDFAHLSFTRGNNSVCRVRMMMQIFHTQLPPYWKSKADRHLFHRLNFDFYKCWVSIFQLSTREFYVVKLIVWHKSPNYMMLYSMIILLFDIDGPLI